MAAAPRNLLGLMFAVIGLVSQITLGAVVLPEAPSAEDQVAAASVLCQTGRDQSPQPAHHAPARPLAFALALPTVVPVPAPLLPPPPAAVIAREPLAAQPRAPPETARLAAQPRGPPALA